MTITEVSPDLLYIGYLIDKYGPYLFALAVTYLLGKLVVLWAANRGIK